MKPHDYLAMLRLLNFLLFYLNLSSSILSSQLISPPFSTSLLPRVKVNVSSLLTTFLFFYLNLSSLILSSPLWHIILSSVHFSSTTLSSLLISSHHLSSPNLSSSQLTPLTTSIPLVSFPFIFYSNLLLISYPLQSSHLSSIRDRWTTIKP